MANPPEIDQLLADRCILKKKLNDVERQLKSHWKQVGTFEGRGLIVCRKQTITPNFALPAAVARAIPDFVDFRERPAEITNYLKLALEAINTRSWRKFLKMLPVGQLVVESLSDDDVITLYGKPGSVTILGSKPKEGSCVILEPGDSPIPSAYQPQTEDPEDE